MARKSLKLFAQGPDGNLRFLGRQLVSDSDFGLTDSSVPNGDQELDYET